MGGFFTSKAASQGGVRDGREAVHFKTWANNGSPLTES